MSSVFCVERSARKGSVFFLDSHIQNAIMITSVIMMKSAFSLSPSVKLLNVVCSLFILTCLMEDAVMFLVVASAGSCIESSGFTSAR